MKSKDLYTYSIFIVAAIYFWPFNKRKKLKKIKEGCRKVAQSIIWQKALKARFCGQKLWWSYYYILLLSGKGGNE